MSLIDIVKIYSEFGCHRTGTETQLATENWLSDILAINSDDLFKFDYTYQHFKAESKVTVSGRLIQSLPLFYEATGNIIESTNIQPGSMTITEDEAQAYSEIKQISTRAKEDDYDAVIIATTGQTNSLYALNVTPVLKRTIPVVLIAGKELKKLEAGEVKLDYSASVSEHSAQNIIARFGLNSPGSPIVITTPMSGWFNCAGERGTGIALAIELAKQLGRTTPVELILASGHELGYLGGFKFSNSLNTSPAAVIHIGSCVGAINSSMNAWHNFSSETNFKIDQLMNNLNISTTFVTEPLVTNSWVGEAECWAQFGCPMISIAGTNPLFHTIEDQWQVAATENSLEEMLSVLLEIGKLVRRFKTS